MVAEQSTNLEKLTPSRKPVRAGDVFALGIGGRYFHGRVVSTEADVGMSAPAILAYVFETPSAEPGRYRDADLLPDRLLIPPFMVNRLPWSRGYFQTVAHRPLGPGEVLAQHCFHRLADGNWYDEHGAELPERVEPCGVRALSSHRSVDDKVSARLGLPLAAD